MSFSTGFWTVSFLRVAMGCPILGQTQSMPSKGTAFDKPPDSPHFLNFYFWQLSSWLWVKTCHPKWMVSEFQIPKIDHWPAFSGSPKWPTTTFARFPQPRSIIGNRKAFSRANVPKTRVAVNRLSSPWGALGVLVFVMFLMVSLQTAKVQQRIGVLFHMCVYIYILFSYGALWLYDMIYNYISIYTPYNLHN